ncbi:MAG: glycosyltransferase family 4 protein, partial [Steroidobacteraceae bacterium]
MTLSQDDLSPGSRVFIISEFVDKSRNSTGYYWHKIIIGLSKERAGINVISTAVSCSLVEKSSHPATYIPVGGIRSYKKNGLFSRALGQMMLSFLFVKSIVRHVKKGDIVFSGTNPAFMLLFISILRPLMGFRWALLVHDIFPENLLPAKVVSRRSPVYPVLKYVFDRAYSRADSLIAIGRDMQELLIKKTGASSKIEYVPNWADLNDVTLEKTSPSIYFSSEKHDRVVFQFFGNIGRVQGIEFILQAISKMKSKKAAFLFIGGGAAESVVTDFIALNPDVDIAHVPSLLFEKNNEGLSACDVAIIPLAPGMLGLGVPSKAYFSMAADKPILVIGDQGAELQLLLNENADVGWFCQSGNADALALIIDQICSIDLVSMIKKPRALIARSEEHT